VALAGKLPQSAVRSDLPQQVAERLLRRQGPPAKTRGNAAPAGDRSAALAWPLGRAAKPEMQACRERVELKSVAASKIVATRRPSAWCLHPALAIRRELLLANSTISRTSTNRSCSWRQANPRKDQRGHNLGVPGRA